MAAPGYLAGLIGPPPDFSLLPEILENDYSLNNTVGVYEGSVLAAWWKFTPTASGVLSVDSLLSTAMDGSQPANVLAILSVDSGLVSLHDDIEGNRSRGVFSVTEDVPIRLAIYGAFVTDLGGYEPIQAGVRLGEIYPMTEGLGESQEVIIRPVGGEAHPYPGGGFSNTQDGYYTAPSEDVTSRIQYWSTRSMIRMSDADTGYAALHSCSWSVGRRSVQGDLYFANAAAEAELDYTFSVRVIEDPTSCPLPEERDSGWGPAPDYHAYAAYYSYYGGYFFGDGLVGAINGLTSVETPESGYLSSVGSAEYYFPNMSQIFSISQFRASSISPPSYYLGRNYGGYGLEFDLSEGASEGHVRSYQNRYGYGYGAAEYAGPDVLAIDVLPDEPIGPNTFALPGWTPGSLKWYVTDPIASHDQDWGYHYKGSNDAPYYPVLRYGAAGPESYDDEDSNQQLLCTYDGGDWIGSGGDWISIPSEILDAARLYETNHFAGISNGGLMLSCLSEDTQSSTPTLGIPTYSDQLVGRFGPRLVLRLTVAVRYRDFEIPPIFDITEPEPTEIDGAFEVSRTIFT